MIKTFTYKFYQSNRNKKLLAQIFIAAAIHNHCIALHKRYYRLTGKYLDLFKLKRHLTKLKKRSEYTHWHLLGSQAIQDIVERIERGYKKFFDYCKQKSQGKIARKVSPPG